MGADIGPAMLAIARAKPAPNGAVIEYVETAAAPLAVGTAEFDVVVCQQGFQFFPDRPAALLEMRRALKPGGRSGSRSGRRSKTSPASPGSAVQSARSWPRHSRALCGQPVGLLSARRVRGRSRGRWLRRMSTEQTHELDVVFEGDGARYADTLTAAGVADEVAALSGGGPSPTRRSGRAPPRPARLRRQAPQRDRGQHRGRPRLS